MEKKLPPHTMWATGQQPALGSGSLGGRSLIRQDRQVGCWSQEHQGLSVFCGGCHSLPRYTASLRLWIRGDSPVSLHGYLSALTPGRSSMVPLSPEPYASIISSLLPPPLPLQQASKSGDTSGGSKGPAIKWCNLVWVLCFDFAQLCLCAYLD